MATKWTDAQQVAINTKNKTLLLSAAAGSGKTSTLTERIIRSITDKDSPADISKMLIVTFTRASATDLKTKIFNALSEALANDPSSKHLSRQLVKLGSAKISTIDSFYLNAVKQNFSALGLSSSFRIADESETVLIANSVMTDIINRFYDTDSEFPSLCECFEKIRDTEGIMEKVLLDLYVECMRTPEGVSYLSSSAQAAHGYVGKDFFDTVYGEILKKYSHMMFADALAVFEDILEKMPLDEKLYRAYYDAFNSDRLLCISVLNMLEGKCESCSYSDIANTLLGYDIPALKSIGKNSSEYSVFCKTFRDTFKSDLIALRDEYFCYSQDDLSTFFGKTACNLQLLYKVLSDFEKDYNEEKRRRNILELTDVKRYALKLFANADGTPTDLAKKYSEQFTDIYIDEYQDVDPVQDLIFRCISSPHNRFMVGDIKQSIYSFRGAKPQLFADYRASFPIHGTRASEMSDSETIFMSENFRCSKPVIDFTNLVCSDIFNACGDSIGYTCDDDLVYAKKMPEGAPNAPKVTVAIFAKSPKKDIAEDVDQDSLPTPAEAEAKYIAKEIDRLITSCKKQDGSPVRPSDIAILFRSKSASERISEALAQVGIKTTNTESSQYFQNPDVMMMLCILNAVDNPQRDVHLAGALRSPIFGFTLDELLLINEYGGSQDSLCDKLYLCAQGEDKLSEKCSKAIFTLEQWRSISQSMPIDKFLWRIFSSDEFVASGLFCEKNALGEGGNLQRLYEYARTFESGSFKGLYNFIEFINEIIENGRTIDARSDNSADDSVTLTTIHKSKGLEFPICFVCSAASPFNTASSNPDISFEYGIGVAMTLSDDTGFAYYSSPLKKILDLNGDFKGVEEEMRVLYVALTRAKEQLYVTGSYSRTVMPTVLTTAEFRHKLRGSYHILSANSYMDWILPATKKESASEFTNIERFTTDALPNFSVSRVETQDKETEEAFDEELYLSLIKKFAFKYPYSELNKLPAKLSVSKLSPDVLDTSDVSVDLFDTEKSPSVPDFFLSSPKKATSAQRGTATHHFLQFCDFSVLKEHGVEQSLDLLVQKGFISDGMVEIIYKDELEAFSHSALMDEILGAQRIIREQRFNILFPASEFTRQPEFKKKTHSESIAVQGVIDLIVIKKDGSICLYDYKTDRLSRDELRDTELASERLNSTHALQLSYYAKAVERLFGKSPDRVAVFSTHASRLFDIIPRQLEIPDIL